MGLFDAREREAKKRAAAQPPKAPTAPASRTPAVQPTTPRPANIPKTGDPAEIWSALKADSEGKGIDYLGKSIDTYMASLKKDVQSGKMGLMEYSQIAEGISQPVTSFFNELTTRGSSAGADSQRASDSLKKYFNWDGAGRSDVKGIKLPFTKAEYANLPDSVLPTEADIKAGKFDETLAPMRRYAPPAPGTPGSPGTPPPNTGPGAGTPVPGYTGPQIVDEYGNTVVTDARQRQIEEEGLRQRAQTQQQVEANRIARQEALNKLGTMLTGRTTQLMNDRMPGVYESLNSRGLLMSSELGNATAREARTIEEANQQMLAQTQLGNESLSLEEQGQMLGRLQGFQSAGLQARLGLEDAEAQKQLAITLAELSKPSQPTGKSSGEKWAQGISLGLQGAQAGATAYAGGK